MAVYTYVDNKDPGDHTGIIIFRGGTATLRRGQWLDITTQELASLSQRFNFVEGTDPSTGGEGSIGTSNFAIRDLNDVDTTSLDDGDVLVWDADAELWKPQAVEGVGGAKHSLTFSAATDEVEVSGSYRVPVSAVVTGVWLSVVTAPVGEDLIVQLLKNEDVISTVTVSDGSTAEGSDDPDTALVAGDRLSVNKTSGGDTPATNVVLQVDMEES